MAIERLTTNPHNHSPAYRGLLDALRGVFEDMRTPYELVQNTGLWAVTAGTIMAENEPYRGLGVVVCSQAVLPPNDGPRLLYSVGLQGPTREMLLGCFEHGGHYLDPSTGQPGDELPEEAYLAMTRAISGTGAGDGAVFEEVYTAKAVAEMTQGLPV